MVICGLKISHDGAVAVIDGDRLVFSTEVEKLANRPRYSGIDDLDLVTEILRAENIDLRDIDAFAVDGWFPPAGESSPVIPTTQSGRALRLPVAPYVGEGAERLPLHRRAFASVGDGALARGYASYAHASSHVLSAYCSSPFAPLGEDALVLAWDGGMMPRLYRADAARVDIDYLGPLFPLIGNIFGKFSAELEPFWGNIATMSEFERERHELEVPGKAMAYAALGTVRRDAFAAFDSLLDQLDVMSVEAASILGHETVRRRRELFPDMSDADLIATLQTYIGWLLLDSFARVLQRDFPGRHPNLCLTGGCALNIKWNSMLRDSGMFSRVWAPPFPNDSGSAIGTACCEMVRQRRAFTLQWNVYQGPRLKGGALPNGWLSRPCDERQLAEILHHEGDPVVVLHGRAELGPRALGNRSILAPATQAGMKDRLNDIKDRALYRPVAPICLASRASEIFSPGGEDPYMVFEHRLRPGWFDRVPAIAHLDGTARLQTIAPSTSHTRTGRILAEYERLSGIPVLCNTSANARGRGLFPHIEAGTEWGRVARVWAEGTLWTRPQFAANTDGRACAPSARKEVHVE